VSAPASGYPVWDLVVRAVHWYLLVAVSVMWWSGEQGRMEIHQWMGLSILCVVAVRVAWGFIGSQPARFSAFLAPPPAVWRYLRRGGQHAGHNPLGGWSVLAMLLLLTGQSVSGLFSRDDLLFEGPFSYWAGEISGALTEWHLLNWQLLQALIATHLLAVAWYQWRKRQPLIQAMWWGRSA
jgi:cytochrome b